MSRIPRPPLSSLSLSSSHASSSAGSAAGASSGLGTPLHPLHQQLGSLGSEAEFEDYVDDAASDASSFYPPPRSAHQALRPRLGSGSASSSRAQAAASSATSAASSLPASAASLAPPRAVALVASGAIGAGRWPAAFVRNTTERDRRLVLKLGLIRRQAGERARIAAATSASGGGSAQSSSSWSSSPFARKERAMQALLLRHSSVYPVCTRHLAAARLQRWWRRLPPSTRHRPSDARKAQAAAQGLHWTHPYSSWQRVVSRVLLLPHLRKKRPNKLTSTYFLETGQYASQLGGSGMAGAAALSGRTTYTLAFKHWCAARIQRAWLARSSCMRRWRSYQLRAVYVYAAIDLQRAWRAHRKARNESRPQSLFDAQTAAACRIQRAWKRFTQRRIFQYFRDLIVARQNSNPYLLLRLLCPSEAAGMDASSGLYVRFRLGGAVFPPILYYKTFSSFAVTDIGSFAPRDYARDRKAQQAAVHLHNTEGLAETDRAFWYRRWENNGWRPIVHERALAERDVVCERTSAVKAAWHPSRTVRKMDALRKRKQKKIEWLRKIYTSGIVQLPEGGADKHGVEEKYADSASAASLFPPPPDGEGELDSDEEEWRAWKERSAAAASSGPRAALDTLMSLNTSDPAALLDPSWESEADQLLDWCRDLDFDSYRDAWLGAATTKPNEPKYRDAILSLPVGAAAKPAASGSAGHVSGGLEAGTAAAGAGLDQALEAQLGASMGALGLDHEEHAALRDHALQTARDLADENADLPAWIGQTASRAQLAALSNQVSQASLRHSPSSSTATGAAGLISPSSSAYLSADLQARSGSRAVLGGAGGSGLSLLHQSGSSRATLASAAISPALSPSSSAIDTTRRLHFPVQVQLTPAIDAASTATQPIQRAPAAASATLRASRQRLRA